MEAALIPPAKHCRTCRTWKEHLKDIAEQPPFQGTHHQAEAPRNMFEPSLGSITQRYRILVHHACVKCEAASRCTEGSPERFPVSILQTESKGKHRPTATARHHMTKTILTFTLPLACSRTNRLHFARCM